MTEPSTPSNAQPSFEDSLGQLELIVQDLEEGQLGLTDSLARYEAGIKHLKLCYQLLQQAERKIELLAGVDADGDPVTQPFDDAELSNEEKVQARSKRRSKAPTKTTAERPPSPATELGEDDAGDVMDSTGRLF